MFKVGDKVKYEDFGEGIVVEINSGSRKNNYLVQFKSQKGKLHNGNGLSNRKYKDEDVWFFSKKTTELKLIKPKQFTKSNLKDEDVVTYRNGGIRVLKGRELIDEEGRTCNNIDYAYSDDLTYKIGDRKYDIIKVERPVQYETVFERKEEILDETEKRYLRGVIRPFRDKVKGIEKHIRVFDSDKAFIRILSNQETMTCLPDFEVDTMYKKMEAEREYTLEELRTIKE